MLKYFRNESSLLIIVGLDSSFCNLNCSYISLILLEQGDRHNYELLVAVMHLESDRDVLEVLLDPDERVGLW